MHTYTSLSLSIYIYMYVCMNVCMHIYIYIYIYEHTGLAAQADPGAARRRPHQALRPLLLLLILL